MSKLRARNHRDGGGTWERIWQSLTGERRCKPAGRKPRRLAMDQLEERTLLSVVPVNVSDQLVNQTILTNPPTLAPTSVAQVPASTIATLMSPALTGKSVATDSNGDFVIVWCNTDTVYDSSGNPVWDPETGTTMTDANIYGRYYTHAVQRVDLPADVTSFWLKYNGNEIQQLSISAGSQPFGGATNIAGTFNLTYGGQDSGPIGYDESNFNTGTFNGDWTDSTNDPALNLQAGLRHLGTLLPQNLLSDVTVFGSDANTFTIAFGPASSGLAFSSFGTSFFGTGNISLSGFLPAIDITAVRTPGMTGMITVSQSDPSATAANVEYAFQNATAQTINVAPTVFSQTIAAPYTAPQTIRTALPAVSVAGRTASQFDITFTGDMGVDQEPLFEVVDAAGNPIVGAKVTIIKQTSDTFRVNAEEPDNPDTQRPDFYNQTSPQVAMDADGDFVITWQSVVPEWQTAGSGTDIFARRFSAAGFVTGVTQTITITPSAPGAVQGSFSLKTERGTTAAIAFDSANLAQAGLNIESGLFGLGYDCSVSVTNTGSSYSVQITWNEAASIPDITYASASWTSAVPTVTLPVYSGNNVSYHADMNHDGILGSYVQSVRPLGSQFRVNTITTNPQGAPAIGMNLDGDFTIAWATEGQNLSFFNSIEAQIFDRDGNRVGNEIRVNSAENTTVSFAPAVAMSKNGIVGVTWTNTTDPNYYLSFNLAGSIQAKIYNGQGTVLMNEFNVGGGGFSSIAFDAGDDFVVGWECDADNDNNGDGTSEGVRVQEYQLYDAAHNISGAVIRSQFRANSASFTPSSSAEWPLWQGSTQVIMDADGDLTVSYNGYGPDVSREAGGGFFNLIPQTDVDEVEQTQLIYQTPSYYGQDLTFTGMPARTFQLVLDGTTTGTMSYDPSYLDGPVGVVGPGGFLSVREQIENELKLIEPGTRVTYDTFTGVFHVAFSTASTTTARPLITMVASALAGSVTAVTTYQSGSYRLALENVAGLLRGEANGVMYSQFDSDPRLSTATSLSSDDVANNNRDGQNTRYLLQIDKSAVSGNFVVSVTNPNPSSTVTATVSITPVYYPNGGYINPYETVKAIHDALQGLVNVGVNWPITTTYSVNGSTVCILGPSIQVRLVTPDSSVTASSHGSVSDEMLHTISTAWDPTAVGYDPLSLQLIYEVTFMGEVHDVPMTLSVTESHLTLAAGATGLSQQLTYPTTAGWYRMYMTIGGTRYYSGNLYYDGTSAGIDSALLDILAQSGDTTTTVTVTDITPPGSASNVYQVTFSTPQPAIQFTTTVVPYPTPAISPKSKMLGAPAAFPLAVCETFGDMGTMQYNASIAMGNSGNFVMVWNENAEYSWGGTATTNVYFRTFQESTDTAGPLATDFLLPNGGDDADLRLSDGDTIRQKLHTIVVTFDEDMMTDGGTTGAHSVLNTDNWALLKDGMLVSGGISAIYYGMNEAAENPLFASLDMPASNKWQAVLVLNGSGNSQTAVADLTDGHYEIVATTALRDKAGNALGRSGFTPDGVTFTRDFDVSIPTGDETLVNSVVAGDQMTSGSDEIQRITFAPSASPAPASLTGYYKVSIGSFTSASLYFNSAALDVVAGNIQAQLSLAGYSGAVVTVESSATTGYVFGVRFGGVNAGAAQPLVKINLVSLAVKPDPGSSSVLSAVELQKGTTAPPPQATASNANGDYVVVWTSDTLGSPGVYAKLYRANWDKTDTTNGHDATQTSLAEVRVTDNATACYASVACDAGGDFVVTWSQNDGTAAAPNWNIYARRYSATGALVADAMGNTNEVQVNSTTVDQQQYSSVGVDADGDYVITWQSLNQDGSGYGIYAQRFNSDGTKIGGVDEVQIISFVNRFTGRFTLTWTNNGITRTTREISYDGNTADQTFLDALSVALIQDVGAHVVVSNISGTDVSIQFVDVDGSKNQNQLVATIAAATGGDPGETITMSTRVEGVSGEFLVNDTTLNDQVFPSIAMNASGAFVISWTGYGQSGDAAYQSNVYAKGFEASKSSEFDIVVQFSGGLTPSQQSIFQLAAYRWESIIVGDVPDVTSAYVGYVDDIVIDASGQDIDGSGGILGQAGPVELRPTSNIPDYGIMQFDTADLADMEASGQLLDVITHEMAHVLGFGSVWNLDNVYVDGTGQYTGAAALAAYRSEFVGQQNATYVPVELGGGQGTADGHWNEVDGGAGATGIVDAQGRDMEYELMTGWLNSPAFISQTTIHQFEDIGYEVSSAAAAKLRQSSLSYSNPVTGRLETLGGTPTYSELLSSGRSGGITSANAGGLPEVLVNTTTSQDQKWSSVAIDAKGNFVVTWTSYGQDTGGNGPGSGVNGENGVYARRFDSSGAAVSGEFRVSTFTDENQQYSRVAMNAAGDFTVVWESYQDRPTFDGTTVNPADVPNSYGIYGQMYVRNSLVGRPLTPGSSVTTGTNGEFQSEFVVNTTTDGNQRYPSIAMNDNGDFLVVWSGIGTQTGQADTQGVFMQRFDRAKDTAGPRVIATYDATVNPALKVAESGSVAEKNCSTFIVTFSEDLVKTTDQTDSNWAHSVYNLNNWSLSREELQKDGSLMLVTVTGGITVTDFRFNAANNQYEAVLTFDGDPTTAGNQALTIGKKVPTKYVLTAGNAIQDRYGNALDGDVDGLPGGNFSRTFYIGGQVQPDFNDKETLVSGTMPSDSPAVACDGSGKYVVVYTSYAHDGGDIVAQRFDQYGNPTLGSSFVVNKSYTNGLQSDPDVAMDTSGNFVVVWCGQGQGDLEGVYAQVYDPFGVTIGKTILVNQTTTSVQCEPSVAMDGRGNFVVTWTSYGQDSDRDGVFARRFSLQGQPLGDGNELQVNQRVQDRQDKSSVAMDPNGDFTVVWESYGQDGGGWGIYGRSFKLNGVNVTPGNEFHVNTDYGSNNQMDPNVAMDPQGNFAVVWSSYAQDGSGYGVYARRYNAAGVAKDAAAILVNEATLYWQVTPDVGMDQSGNAFVTWSSLQDVDVNSGAIDYGICGREIAANNQPTSEFYVNTTKPGDQITPAITVTPKGGSVFVWVGPSIAGMGVYSRAMASSSGTLGAVAPTSLVAALPAQLNAPSFNVSWNGASAPGGASVASYSVFVSVDGGAYSAWLRNTAATTATYQGQIGHTYAFYSVATDVNGNTEAAPGSADAATTLSAVVAAGGSTIGLYDPSVSAYYLKYNNKAGSSDNVFSYGMAGWITIVGDWNGDGTDTIGLYDPTASRFYLRNSNTGGYADHAFAYGPGGAGWIPIVGDWNNDGTDTVGLYDPAASRFYLRNTNNDGYADHAFSYGPGGAGWTPLVGDWNNDGKDTIGLYDSGESRFYLRNTNNDGYADRAFSYGPGGAGWTPIAGDWNNDGTDTIGLYDPATSMFYLRNGNNAGYADRAFAYGSGGAGLMPIVGNWTGTGQSLLAADGALTSGGAAALSMSNLQPIVAEAIARWQNAGLDAAAVQKLTGVQFVISDLSGSHLGETVGTTVYLDVDAAGYGWFVDPTPAADTEFTSKVSREAVDHIDLLSVVEHELGHVLGLEDIDALSNDVMARTLGAGVRQTPSYQDAVDAALRS